MSTQTENPDQAVLHGTEADPAYRHRRAVKAAGARHSIDTYIRSIVERAPELTDEQKATLAELLQPTAGART